MYILTHTEERLCREIMDAAFQVHKKLGPGLLEKICEVCFCYELSKKAIFFRRQVQLPIIYDDRVFDEGLRIDVLVEERIVCEIKAAEIIHPVYLAQVLSYLRLAEKKVGFLINFNSPTIKEGTQRFCLR